jgi:hypothetical protein
LPPRLPDNPSGLLEDEEQEAESKMVTATVRITVVDGEVIPVENTPLQPPPLPEPPPFGNVFDPHRCLHSSTSTDGEKKLLFRSMNRVGDDDDVDADITPVLGVETTNDDSDTVDIIQLIVLIQDAHKEILYQDKMMMIRQFQLIYYYNEIMEDYQVILYNNIVPNWCTYIGNNDAYNNNIIIDSSLIYAFDFINDNVNANFSASINGERYTSQSKYQEDYNGSTLHVNDQYGYTTTTIDGELILLFRLAYRVDIRYRFYTVLSSIVLLIQSVLLEILLFRLAHRVDIRYQVYIVLSSIASVIQTGLIFVSFTHDE